MATNLKNYCSDTDRKVSEALTDAFRTLQSDRGAVETNTVSVIKLVL
jgi:hypothetical protein